MHSRDDCSRAGGTAGEEGAWWYKGRRAGIWAGPEGRGGKALENKGIS